MNCNHTWHMRYALDVCKEFREKKVQKYRLYNAFHGKNIKFNKINDQHGVLKQFENLLTVFKSLCHQPTLNKGK